MTEVTVRVPGRLVRQGDPAARDGWLLYIKPALCGSEPADVCEYAATHAQFPHEVQHQVLP